MSFSKRLYLAAVNMVESSQQATLLDGYVVDGNQKSANPPVRGCFWNLVINGMNQLPTSGFQPSMFLVKS